ncbi:unnamed protein product [Adineta steineri]|uniref:Uncharacterized protein n=1 Tax=Adineta steineri TaxID=433720 RepID=A0A814RWK8_9BILA|nr:unnamed protein product [Adineta steineri]CAF1277453.1 unnamed protein product [Adineta steineri]CAF3667672.1 unnamed protein product [Adineta steineri]CAF3814860.1 unnamed protein product [Adineta steineri]
MTNSNDNQNNDSCAKQLEELNKLFINRYTENDEEFIEMTKGSQTPPTMEDWGPDRVSYRPQQSGNGNQRRHFSNPRQDYGNQRQQHRYYSNNNRQQNRYSLNDNREYRDRSRSPPYRDTRR